MARPIKANRTAFHARAAILVGVLMIVAAALAGCGRSGAPAPVDYRTASARAPGGIYTVQRGDTVYGISQKFNVSNRSVIDANNLRPPYLLQIGQKIRIPSPAVHVVRRGDTAYGISRQYGVDLHELVSLNGMRPPYTLYVGQRVRLPGSTASRQVASARSAESKGRSGAGAAPAKTSKRVTAVPQPPPRSAGRFMWPARGRVISRFGSKNDGLHNDGINIAAPKGTPIVAAENGVVAYVGNELRGFGNLVLLKHADGYITAYAHAEEILVERGEKVARGQTIGRVGTSGTVKDPQLHFEVRRGTRAIDPQKLLGPMTAGAVPDASPAAPAG